MTRSRPSSAASAGTLATAVALLALLASCGGTSATPAERVVAACAKAQTAIDALPDATTRAELPAAARRLHAILDQSARELMAIGGTEGRTIGNDVVRIDAGVGGVGGAADEGDLASAADAATAALDQLDSDAGRLRLAGCTSETWGRRFFVVVGDLTLGG